MNIEDRHAVVSRTWFGRYEITYAYTPEPEGVLHWVSITRTALLWGPRKHLGILHLDAPLGIHQPRVEVEELALFYVHQINHERRKNAWWNTARKKERNV